MEQDVEKTNNTALITGYLALLEQSEPNGRVVHKVKNCITTLRLKLRLDTSLDPSYETKLKALINELYAHEGAANDKT